LTKKIVIASHNPVKINAALHGFRRMFPGTNFEIKPVSVPSGVSGQPATEAETKRGAQNRVDNAAAVIPQADFWVGIEGGVETTPDGLTAFAWVIIKSGSTTGKARTGAFLLPPKVSELVFAGKELGEADDIFFGKSNSKQKDGAIGLLTGNVINRQLLYEHAVILALPPFKNPDLF
jgi:inosine/xanthosine triphosphatase